MGACPKRIQAGLLVILVESVTAVVVDATLALKAPRAGILLLAPTALKTAVPARKGQAKEMSCGSFYQVDVRFDR